MTAPSSCAQLLRKGRKLAAVGVRDLCLKAVTASQNSSTTTTTTASPSSSSSSTDDSEYRQTVSTVEELLREILDPQKPISEPDNIDWIRHILASGESFEEYVGRLKAYDHSVTCGFVWTSNFGEWKDGGVVGVIVGFAIVNTIFFLKSYSYLPFAVAYRCRTCGVSPCMSLCAECFHLGDHEGHDFNMFKSQAGGACDCGDVSVMRKEGFCTRHGPDHVASSAQIPVELSCVPSVILPHVLFRLVLQVRFC